jgi:hypothetical protein
MKIWAGVIIGVVILLGIILSPIWIPILAIVYISNKIEAVRFRKYLSTGEGAKYFCYTDKYSSKAFVENNIVPFLPPDVEVLHVSSKRLVNLGKHGAFSHRIAIEMKAMKKGFPCVAKISGGRLIAESINQQLYNAIYRKKDARQIVETINRFFGRDDS